MEVYKYKEDAVINAGFTLLKIWSSAMRGAADDETFDAHLITFFDTLRDYDRDRFYKTFGEGIE